MSAAVQPENILKDLQKLWIDLGKQDSGKNTAGVLRACAMTLIAAVEEEADAQAASETIARIMHAHPSRAILLRVSEKETGLEARVSAQCWMPFGRQEQICCEQIEITAAESRLADLPKLMLGLIAPDLPVVLWCMSDRLCRNANFRQLFRLTDKIVIDSAAFRNPAEPVPFVKRQLANGRNIADLAWTRLTHVRELVAQIFENDSARKSLSSLNRIAIQYAGPQAEPAELHYLQAWFANAVKARIEVTQSAQQAGFELQQIQMDAPGFEAALELRDDSAQVRVNGLTRRMSFPKPSEAELMREELSIIGEDPVFRRCI